MLGLFVVNTGGINRTPAGSIGAKRYPAPPIPALTPAEMAERGARRFTPR